MYDTFAHIKINTKVHNIFKMTLLYIQLKSDVQWSIGKLFSYKTFF